MEPEKANKLRIVVSRDGNERVNLTFPIYTLKHIQSIMPEIVLEKLKEREIDLGAILKRVEDSEFIAQTIFEMSTSEKSYKVWIE